MIQAMDDTTKDFLYKLLLWGGGGLVLLVVLKVFLGIVWSLITSPLGLLIVGGAGYFGYRKFKGQKEEKEKVEDFSDDDFYTDFD